MPTKPAAPTPTCRPPSRLGAAAWARGAALALALGLSACGGGGGGADTDPPPVAPRDHFPLQIGDRWFLAAGDGSAETSARVTGTRLVDGQTATVVEFWQEGVRSELLYVKTSGAVRQLVSADADAQTQAVGPLQLVKLPLVAGETFVQVDKTFDAGVDADGDGRNDTMTVRAEVTVIGFESVSTPAGTFADSAHVRTVTTQTLRQSGGGAPAVVTVTNDDWLAPGIGPVRRDSTIRVDTVTDTSSRMLQAYAVNGVRSESVAPAVSSVVPTVAAPGGALAIVELGFSEAMDSSTLNAGTITVTDAAGAAVAGTVTAGPTWARFAPTAAWTTGNYTVRVGTAAQDRLGNALATAFGASFGIDTSRP